MYLTTEEQSILNGKYGRTQQKILNTLVLYGNALKAERFIDIEWGGHFALHHVLPGIGPRLEMLQELVDAGLRTPFSFTIDPFPPLDFENLDLSVEQQRYFLQIFSDQEYFTQLMWRLGLRTDNAYTCTPYLPEVDNIPPRGSILAWSESSAVVYVNSVIGARTNRNAVILDLLSNLLRKTPCTGLLTEEGRHASWKVEIRTSELPAPQLLGGAIGKRVQADVPYIIGLDSFLSNSLDDEKRDYLKEMGAAAAAIGAVGLYHAEHITPEAVDQGEGLLLPDYKTYIINDYELEEIQRSYPVMWADRNMSPQRCLIGCPHLSLRELHLWLKRIDHQLNRHNISRLAVPTILAAAPQVIAAFKKDHDSWNKMKRYGIRLSPTCLEAFMQNPLIEQEAIITNSNKLRYFTHARYLPDELILEVMAGERLAG